MSVREKTEAIVAELEWPKDSLDMMDLIMRVEDEFNIIININDVAEIKNIDDLVAAVEKEIENA
jgi:acyl carrier protein